MVWDMYSPNLEEIYFFQETEKYPTKKKEVFETLIFPTPFGWDISYWCLSFSYNPVWEKAVTQKLQKLHQKVDGTITRRGPLTTTSGCIPSGKPIYTMVK